MKKRRWLLLIPLLLLFFPFPLFAEGVGGGANTAGKVRVAVGKFGATDRFSQVYGGWDIGGGLAAQLVTELIQGGQVIVVERGVLSQIIREQELSASKLVTKETAAQVGQLLGVDYMIVGEVTEFEQKAVGGGGRAGILKWIFPKVSSEFSAAHVAIDMRVIDTTTGEIVFSHRAEGRAWEKAVAVDLNFPSLTFGGDAFHKTPLGKATRQTIHDAVQFVLGAVHERLQPYASSVGKVIHLEGPLVYISAGLNAQLQVGNRLSVFSVQKTLTDPETNQVVGVIEQPVVDLEVVFVAEKFSKAKSMGSSLPKKGDIVRLAEKPRMEHSPSGHIPSENGSNLPISNAGYSILD